VKYLFFIVTVFFAGESFACFSPPEGLRELHESQSFFAFCVAIALLFLSVILRLVSNVHRLWVPLLFITTFTYFPAYFWHWGQQSGSCGSPEIVFAFRVWACGMAVLFIYEAFVFIKVRRANAT
jgi:hypothetical protein